MSSMAPQDLPAATDPAYNATMAVRCILQLGDATLWTPCAPVDYSAPRALRAVITDLAETLAAFHDRAGFGRGIAAPQICALTRVIFLRMQPDGFTGVLCNPRISFRSPEQMELWDDCFSFPDLMVRVTRA